MSTITKDTVSHIAKLARIRLNAEEEARYATELSTILNWVEQLQEVKTDDVPMMTSPTEVELPWRKDAVDDGGRQEQVLANAPAREYGCFVVPKVIE